MAKGDSNDILSRVKQLLPARWFSWVAPNRDALLGALSDMAATCYNWFGYIKPQTRIRTATSFFLDMISWDFLQGRFGRRPSETDISFQARLIKEILRPRVTRAAITQLLLDLVGQTPIIHEPWNPGDMGTYGTGQTGYGMGLGYGSLALPYQVFIDTTQSGQGIPSIAGYGSYLGGYGVGSAAYVDLSQEIGSITSAEIYTRIAQTVAAGVTPWTNIQGEITGTFGSLKFNAPTNSEWILMTAGTL